MRSYTGVIICMVLMSAFLTVHQASAQATFIVNSLGDAADNNPGDGFCNDGSGNCTLRAALQEANQTTAKDSIAFIVTGPTPTIMLSGILPFVTEPIVIDGSTTVQGRVGINGSSLSASTMGFYIDADSTIIRGLALIDIPGNGIEVGSGYTGNIFENNFIGLSYDGLSLGCSSGTVCQGSGITLFGGATNSVIGGANASSRNIIAGFKLAQVRISGGSGHRVEGNYFGTNKDGDEPLGGGTGINIAFGSQNDTLKSNLIAGLDQAGINISGNAQNILVAGNLLGTDVTGTQSQSATFASFANKHGIWILSSQNVTVGGSTTAERNIISNSDQYGILVTSGAEGTVIRGNFVGTDINGTVDLGNAKSGIRLDETTNTTIGGDGTGFLDGAENLISGNDEHGISIDDPNDTDYATGLFIYNNLIGSDVTGMAALGNSMDGIYAVISQATIQRNLISGNGRGGLTLIGTGSYGTDENVIIGNAVGASIDLNAFKSSGAFLTLPLGNESYGMAVLGSSDNEIGSTDGDERNFFAANDSSGVIFGLNPFPVLDGSGNPTPTINYPTDNLFINNYIGVDPNDTQGSVAFGNGAHGIEFQVDQVGTIGGQGIDQGNLIANNGGAGIRAKLCVDETTNMPCAVNPLLGNIIYNNAGLGIETATDGVNGIDQFENSSQPGTISDLIQNAPQVEASGTVPGKTRIDGMLLSDVSALFRVEFFTSTSCDPSGYGEGGDYLGFQNVQTDAAGIVSFSINIPKGVAVGDYLTATATKIDPVLFTSLNTTSEFSQCKQIESLFETDLAGTEGWRMISNPVFGATLNDFLSPLWTQGFTGSDAPGASQSNVMYYNTSLGNFISVNDQADAFSTTTGYIVYTFSDDNYDGTPEGFPKTISMIGTQNAGDYTPSLVYNANNQGWNLMGNPYGRPVGWDNLTKNQLENVVYVYDPAAGNYKTWNGLAGELTGGAIAAFQGFWVQTQNGASSASLGYELADTVSSAAFYGKRELVPIVKLEAKSNTGKNSLYITFEENGRTGHDPRDAFELTPFSDTYFSLFAVNTRAEKLDINNLPLQFGKELRIGIDLMILDEKEGMEQLTLEWPKLQNIPPSWELVLVDKENGRQIHLLEEESYSFSAMAIKAKKRPGAVEKTQVPSRPTPLFYQKETPSRFELVIQKKAAAGAQTVLPQQFVLQQNYPNPFNPSTTIKYALPKTSRVRLAVYDMLGRKVATLVDKQQPAGFYTQSFNASRLASGIYLFRLDAGSYTQIQKMALIK